MALTKITDGVRDTMSATKLTGTIDEARISTLTATKLTGTIDEARISTLTATKLTGNIANARIPASAVSQHVTHPTEILENDIAMLGFKVATADSLAKYNLVDQVIDEFVDSSGIDAGASTNETLSGGYYSGSGSTMSTHYPVTAGMISHWGNKSPNYVFYGFSAAALVDGGTTSTGGFNIYSAPFAAGSWVRIDLGSGNAQPLTKWTYYFYTSSVGVNWKIQYSDNNSSWTDASGVFAVGGTNAIGNISATWSSVGSHRYWRSYQTDGVSSNSTSWHDELRVYPGIAYNDLTLQSVATTAEAAPTTADMVMLIEDGAGTATINTDVKGYISRDGGSNWTQGTLASEGSWGTNKKILAFHNLSISSQPSGTSMKYKITTHNQAEAKQTRIHAVSLAWA